MRAIIYTSSAIVLAVVAVATVAILSNPWPFLAMSY